MKIDFTIPAPTGPFPVLQLDPKTKRVVNVIGKSATHAEGAAAIAVACMDWEKSKKGRSSHRSEDRYSAMLFFSDGKLMTLLVLETVPVPADNFHPGDILVDRPGVK